MKFFNSVLDFGACIISCVGSISRKEINNSTDNLNSSNVNDDENDYYDSQDSNSNNNDDDFDSYDEAMEAKLGIEKYDLGNDEIAKYPTFKAKDGSWLVPIFDKKTKKFKGSIYIYGGGQLFISGPKTYSEYKKVISGKTTRHDSNKHVKVSKKNTKKSVKKQKTIRKVKINQTLT